jgi:hypothetical protein
MATRPCKPDGDLKKLWQTLMPGVAMPSCGTVDDAKAGEGAKAEPGSESNDPKSPRV